MWRLHDRPAIDHCLTRCVALLGADLCRNRSFRGVAENGVEFAFGLAQQRFFWSGCRFPCRSSCVGGRPARPCEAGRAPGWMPGTHWVETKWRSATRLLAQGRPVLDQGQQGYRARALGRRAGTPSRPSESRHLDANFVAFSLRFRGGNRPQARPGLATVSIRLPSQATGGSKAPLHLPITPINQMDGAAPEAASQPERDFPEHV